MERVTVTLPHHLVRDIDRWEANRSRFVAEAVRRELERRRRDELRRSLQNAHPESADLVEQGVAEWSRRLPEEDTESLLENGVGKTVHWIPGQGWVESPA